jgi:hypothetical protein
VDGCAKRGHGKIQRKIPLYANLSRPGNRLISSREAQVGTDFGDVELKGYFLADGDVWRGEWLRNDEIRPSPKAVHKAPMSPVALSITMAAWG